MSEASDQITEYLSVGGLFNPEMMNQTQHEAVRDTLIKARDDIQSLERENAALREAKDAYFNHNNILVQLMTEEQNEEALEILMSRPKEAKP